MNVARAFGLWCGPDVKYARHERTERNLAIWFTVPESPEPGLEHKINTHLANGLDSTFLWAVRRIAYRAMQDGYMRSGRSERDMKMLLEGKLV